MTHSLTRTGRTAALAVACAAAMLASTALAGAAAAAVETGHYDIAAEVDCAAETIELVAENHDTEETFPLADTVFEVTSGNDDEQTANDTGRFATGPLRVLSEDEDEVPAGKFVLGLEVGYDNCSSTPAVTFLVDQADPDLDVPSGGRAAAYLNDGTTATQMDTASGSGRNGGAAISGHEDRRWGFETAGDYTLPVTATINFGGGNVSTGDNVLIEVS